MVEKKNEVDSFRQSLEDVVAIAEKLGTLCDNSISELVDLSKLALMSDAQARLLLKEMTRDKR